MALPSQQPPGGMRLTYFVAPALGIAGIWAWGWRDPRPDILGKFISSVLLLILWVVVVLVYNWKRERKRQQKIRGAVLSRRPAPAPEDPVKD